MLAAHHASHNHNARSTYACMHHAPSFNVLRFFHHPSPYLNSFLLAASSSSFLSAHPGPIPREPREAVRGCAQRARDGDGCLHARACVCAHACFYTCDDTKIDAVTRESRRNTPARPTRTLTRDLLSRLVTCHLVPHDMHSQVERMRRNLEDGQPAFDMIISPFGV